MVSGYHDDGALDRVVSTFMLHHVPTEARPDALSEARRVLVAGGELHLVDFVQTHAQRDVADMLAEAGFVDATEIARDRILFGAYVHWRGRDPGDIG